MSRSDMEDALRYAFSQAGPSRDLTPGEMFFRGLSPDHPRLPLRMIEAMMESDNVLFELVEDEDGHWTITLEGELDVNFEVAMFVRHLKSKMERPTPYMISLKEQQDAVLRQRVRDAVRPKVTIQRDDEEPEEVDG